VEAALPTSAPAAGEIRRVLLVEPFLHVHSFVHYRAAVASEGFEQAQIVIATSSVNEKHKAQAQAFATVNPRVELRWLKTTVESINGRLHAWRVYRRANAPDWVVSSIYAVLGMVLFVLAWGAIARMGGRIPDPAAVWKAAVVIFSDPFYSKGPNDQGIGWNVLSSLRRVALGFGAAAAVGAGDLTLEVNQVTADAARDRAAHREADGEASVSTRAGLGLGRGEAQPRERARLEDAAPAADGLLNQSLS
jgi:cytochrome b